MMPHDVCFPIRMLYKFPLNWLDSWNVVVCILKNSKCLIKCTDLFTLPWLMRCGHVTFATLFEMDRVGSCGYRSLHVSPHTQQWSVMQVSVHTVYVNTHSHSIFDFQSNPADWECLNTRDFHRVCVCDQLCLWSA